MREIWFSIAIITTLGAVFTDDDRIHLVAVLTSVVFWLIFLVIQREKQRYDRLSAANNPSNKDA